eukprot:TRINITY_DN10832_c0_g1_i4.p1 TRINITY_DN10832_c0_g1~~TRINITY_DN10832_c0_g1_i4.p1  ORF type:complete len:386 (-),score=70.55 TRINITY_DN10832_c0_g1_i4:36-1193(-)
MDNGHSMVQLLQRQLLAQEEAMRVHTEIMTLQRALLEHVTDTSMEAPPVELSDVEQMQDLSRIMKEEALALANGAREALGQDVSMDLGKWPGTEANGAREALGQDVSMDLDKWPGTDVKSNWWRAGLCELFKHPLQTFISYDFLPEFTEVCLASLKEAQFKQAILTSLEQLAIFLALLMSAILPISFEMGASKTTLQVLENTALSCMSVMNICEVIAVLSMYKIVYLIPDKNIISWAASNRFCLNLINSLTALLAWMTIAVSVLRMVDSSLKSDPEATGIGAEPPCIAMAVFILVMASTLFPAVQVAARSAVYSGAFSNNPVVPAGRRKENSPLFFGAALQGQRLGLKKTLHNYREAKEKFTGEKEKVARANPLGFSKLKKHIEM